MTAITMRVLLSAMLVCGMAALYGCASDPAQPASTTTQQGVQTIRQTRENIKDSVRTISQTGQNEATAEKNAAMKSVEDLKAEGEAIKRDAAEIKQILTNPTK
ncbi:MAG: hypothetical protein U0172_02250 [Nitrospiraceae bacterium]